MTKPMFRGMGRGLVCALRPAARRLFDKEFGRFGHGVAAPFEQGKGVGAPQADEIGLALFGVECFVVGQLAGDDAPQLLVAQAVQGQEVGVEGLGHFA